MAPRSNKDRPLRSLGEAFETLAWELENGESKDLTLKSYVVASKKISDLLGHLGIAFKFAERDFNAKVDDLLEASKRHETLSLLLDSGAHHGPKAAASGPIRSALYVSRGADMVQVLFQQILTSRHSLKECALKAYVEVFVPYHSWAVRKAVTAGMHTLPSRAQFLRKINEDDASAWAQMQAYLRSATPVTRYINGLYISRGIGLEL